ncbi:MAG: hypothetical protein KF715_04445 [Candidatus Didemnitutus sp.]|nr:hypothetical protein [Candidatus Didemnitutus sp.]
MTRKARCAGSVRFEKEAEIVEETAAQRWRRRAWLIGLTLAAAAVAGGIWLWGEERELAQAKIQERAALAVVEEQLAAARSGTQEAGLTPEETIHRWEKLAGWQRRRAAMRPERFASEVEELRRTERQIETMRAARAQKASEEKETAARARLAAGDGEGGIALLREALKLQRTAATADKSANFDRELRLQRELEELVAEPMSKTVAAKTAEAQAALDAAQWVRALAAFREARDMQEHLNREFPRTRFSDLPAIGRLEAEIAALMASELDAAVRDGMRRAEELRAAGDIDRAVKELVAAADGQRQLNERFAKSRFLSMERLEQIEAERQTLLAAEPLRAAVAAEERARHFLRKRQVFQAQQSVREGLELCEDVAKRFPKLKQTDDAVRTALAYLNVRSADIATVQDRIFDQLVPLSGARALLKTEVLQADFAKVMSSNPSRNPGRALPVDSVTFAEAEEFCRRLGWLLGWRVRLPSADELREGAADAQNVNGGLEEWLASAGGRETTEANVWRGEGGVTPVARTERARTRGFRVVVEVDLTRLDAAE